MVAGVSVEDADLLEKKEETARLFEASCCNFSGDISTSGGESALMVMAELICRVLDLHFI